MTALSLESYDLHVQTRRFNPFGSEGHTANGRDCRAICRLRTVRASRKSGSAQSVTLCIRAALCAMTRLTKRHLARTPSAVGRGIDHVQRGRIPRGPTAVLAILLLGFPVRLHSQAASTGAWSLVNVRYDTRTSDAVYTAYGWKHLFALFGALDNPRSKYTELVAGIGGRFADGGRSSQYVALAASRAPESWYAQLSFHTTMSAGVLTTHANTLAYLPLSRAGAGQLHVNVSSVVALGRAVAAGPVADVAADRGARTSLGFGPELRIALPSATLGVDAYRQIDVKASRVRVFLGAAF